jgi:DNA-3-methyladenine glycosylase II
MPGTQAHFTISLPPCYRADEVLIFHRRDPEGLAERATPKGFQKGVLLAGIPVVLELALGTDRARGTITSDGALTKASLKLLKRTAGNLLGLSIDPEPFERAVQGDRLLGMVVKRQAGLRIPQMASPFETLMWAIIGQQIHLSFAIALRRTFILLAGARHSSGLWCHPNASEVARMNPEDLARRKFSRAKAETLVRVARMVDEGKLPLNEWRSFPAERIEEALLAVKGIGPWTVHYTLLRGFGCADCSLHGDAAVRNAVHRLQGGEARPTMAEVQALLNRYKPHRSLAAVHLWASLRASKG